MRVMKNCVRKWSRCSSSAGKVTFERFQLSGIQTDGPFWISAMARYPSHLISKIQFGRSNGLETNVHSIGSTSRGIGD